MDALELQRRYLDLTTPHVADALLRFGIEVRQAPVGMRPPWSDIHLGGRALVAQRADSVDVFLEAIELALPSDVLVVDNAGRDDEACVGDLVALETHQAQAPAS